MSHSPRVLAAAELACRLEARDQGAAEALTLVRQQEGSQLALVAELQASRAALEDQVGLRH